jgi:hypothetical protein
MLVPDKSGWRIVCLLLVREPYFSKNIVATGHCFAHNSPAPFELFSGVYLILQSLNLQVFSYARV